MARAEADRARVEAGECVRETDAYKRGIGKKLESLQVMCPRSPQPQQC